ncbi:MAG: glycogen/starch synthase, partial [Alistipes sp.]|nr:glycogen/starch synthase [Alistipes sp.]
VLETVKKLRWTPNIVHCHGWFSAIVPMYLRKVFYDDPVFRDVKIVLSLPDDRFEKPLCESMRSKIESEGILDSNLKILNTPSYENLYRFVIDYADGVIATSPAADSSLLEYARSQGKKVLEYGSPDKAETFDNYKRFYEEL